MNKLIFDIGNSFIKGCYAGNQIYGVRRIPYSKPEFGKYFREFIAKFKKRPDAVFIITQNENLISTVKSAVNSVFPQIGIETPGIDFKTPLKVSYTNTLGQDRYYASAGAFFKFITYKNILVIDMGTATTVNFISNGIFKGGMIAPGIPAAAVSLAGSTTLPLIKLRNNFKLINTDTLNSINSGIILQQKYFIESTVKSYKKNYRDLLTVVTGGGYKYIKGKIDGIDVYEKNLVLEGINFIINSNYDRKK